MSNFWLLLIVVALVFILDEVIRIRKLLEK